MKTITNVYAGKIPFITNKAAKAVMKTESGTYVKETISGDEGRTKPSFAELLGCDCKCVKLNVLEVHKSGVDDV